MQNLLQSIGRNAHFLVAIVVVTLAGPRAAHGQAIVTYGVNVGRAAGAGAAAGAGTAGIFEKLGRATDDAAKHEAKGNPTVKASSAANQNASAPDAITVAGNTSRSSADQPNTVQTASGISIAGLSFSRPSNLAAPNAVAEVREISASAAPNQAPGTPDEPEGFRLPEVPMPGPAPEVTTTRARVQSPEPRPQTERPLSNEQQEQAVSAQQPPRTEEAAASLVIAEGIAPKPVAPHADGRPTPIPPTITAGMPIQHVIRLLGQPLMRLSGIEGADYDERYVFLTADGSRLTILAQNGLVLELILE